VDRGTADMSFTLPVTRWGILRAETAVWKVAGLFLLAMALVGNQLGGQYVEHVHRPPLDRTLIVLANLFCVYAAVGGLSWLVSAASNRRGVALTVVFVILLASFLLNFLAQFWELAERLAFLGLLHYYRPLFILRDGVIPWRDMGILVAVAAVLWTAAGITFSRRDISTV
jgi:ABC-2 type transport system permease protein